MLPYILCIAALAALATSLYKDRKVERSERSVIHALRIHHFAQAMLVLLTLWNAIDTERSLRESRTAQLDAAAAVAASQHTAPLLEQYLFTLVPSAPALTSYFTYQRGIADLPPQVAENLDWNHRASPALRSKRNNGLRAFSELQRIARTVLAEQVMFGDRYPSELVKWATKTLELKEEHLPAILNESAEAVEYAYLLGRGIGFSVGKFQEAQLRFKQ